jgi:hypothetical protein
VTDDVEGRRRRPRGAWETEHLDDVADDADRFDEAPAPADLALIAATNVQAIAGWQADLDGVLLLFNAVDAFGAAFVPAIDVRVTIALPTVDAAALVGALAEAVIEAAEHEHDLTD